MTTQGWPEDFEDGDVESQFPDDIEDCRCGSGKERRELNDARGIFVAYVCDDCEATVKKRYRADIFTNPGYETDEPIDDY